jgi:hypothetical protein
MPVATVKEDGSVSINLRGVLMLLAAVGVIGGSAGGVTNWSLADSEAEKNAEQDSRLETHKTIIEDHDQKIEGITVKIGEIQSTQHWQAADQAAARICAEQPDRTDCEKRIIRWSIDRLQRGKTRPCTNLDCTD